MLMRWEAPQRVFRLPGQRSEQSPSGEGVLEGFILEPQSVGG